MRYQDFEGSPTGQLVRTDGVWAFAPAPLPPAIDYRSELVELISQAEADLGTLRGAGGRLANPHLLIMPYVRREAVLSSRIEGTQSTLSDLFLFEIDPEEHANIPDVREVSNYVRAMEEALQRLNELPLSLRLVRQLHATLLEGVRGEEHTPGEFRRHQNWIGARGASIESSRYVPPPVPQMLEALDSWEKFLHVRRGIPVLVQCALLHYQFEAIHPFYDGNGRVGRLLITLFLCERRRLTQPLLYLSAFFESHREEYYDHLLAVTRDGNWPAWLEFFLQGVSSQADAAVRQADKILGLHNVYRERLQIARATGSTLATLDRLFENPFVTVNRVARVTDSSVPTAQRVIDRLADAGIVQEITGRKRGRVFCARELLRTLEEPPPDND